MLNRYIRITPQMKTTDPVDIEISGFKLFSGSNQVDISTANVRINFVPVSGDASIIKRDTIVIGEALVIPATKTRGTGVIYIDLNENKSFDAFQIGFGSTQAKSLTKLKVEYSNDGIVYRRLADITMNVRLKYRNPWTFSGLTANATSGFPAVLQKSLHHQFINYQTDLTNKAQYPRHYNSFISNDGRSIFSRKGSQDTFDGQTFYGAQIQTTLSSHLRRGKYYFEVWSKSGVNWPGRGAGFFMGINLETKNGGQTGGSWGDWISGPPAGAAWPSRAMLFNFSTAYSGYRDGNNYYQVNQAVSNGSIPPGFIDVPGGKKGLLGGFAVDTQLGVIKLINSPFAPAGFQFNGPELVSSFINRADNVDERCYFSIFAPGKHDSANMDLTFNFGQDPFVGAVPDGFDDRIGMRWEVELDPNFKTHGNFPDMVGTDKAHQFFLKKPFAEVDNNPLDDLRRNNVVDPRLTYYIKGKVSDIDGKFPRRNLELFTYPQMQLMGSCGSSLEDGTYEFLNLWNRDYVVVSTDSLSGKFESIILGPIKPVPMDPTK